MNEMLKAYSTAQHYYNQLESIVSTSKDRKEEVVVLNKNGTLERLDSGVCACFYRWMVGSTPCQPLARKFNELGEKVASARTRHGERKVTKRHLDEIRYLTVHRAIGYLEDIQDDAKPYFNCLAKDFVSKTNRYPTSQEKYEAIKRYLDTHCVLDAITCPKVLERIIREVENLEDVALREECQFLNDADKTKWEEAQRKKCVWLELNAYLSALREEYECSAANPEVLNPT